MTAFDIYKGLNEGKRYILKSELRFALKMYVSGEWRYFTPNTTLYAGDDLEYIYNNFHGSSATRNTLEDLEDILEIMHDIDGVTVDDLVELNYETLTDMMNEGHGSWEYRGETNKATIEKEI